MKDKNISREVLTFKLDGENEIEISNFAGILSNTANIFNKIVNSNNVDKNIKANFKIVAIREGSFEFDLATIIEYLPMLFKTTIDSFQMIQAFLEWIKIKDWIKGEKVEKIEKLKNGNGAILTKINGDSNTVTNNLNITIFTDSSKLEEIDKYFTKLGLSLPEGRKMVLSSEGEVYNYSKDVKKNLEAPLNIIEKDVDDIEVSVVTRNIVLKKVDFDMKSKWQVYIVEKLYEVAILDEEFKEHVLSGRFTANKGTKLKVDLKEIIRSNSKGEIIEVHYEVLKVYPKEETLSLF